MLAFAIGKSILTLALAGLPTQRSFDCDLSQFRLAVDKTEVEASGVLTGYLGAKAQPNKGDRLVIVTMSGSVPSPCEVSMGAGFFLATGSFVTRPSVASRMGYQGRYESWSIQMPESSLLRLGGDRVSLKVLGPINFQAAFSVPEGIRTIDISYKDQSGAAVSVGRAAISTPIRQTQPSANAPKGPTGCDLGGKAIASPGLIERDPFTGEGRQCVKKGDNYVWVPVTPNAKTKKP